MNFPFLSSLRYMRWPLFFLATFILGNVYANSSRTENNNALVESAEFEFEEIHKNEIIISSKALKGGVYIDEYANSFHVYSSKENSTIFLGKILENVSKDVMVEGASGLEVRLERKVDIDHSILIKANQVVLEESISSSKGVFINVLDQDKNSNLAINGSINARTVEIRSDNDLIIKNDIIAPGQTILLFAKNSIEILPGVELNTSSPMGGGKILIGGEYQGKGGFNAKFTNIHEGVEISADATENGRGGEVIIWADNKSTIHGSISAKGTVKGGFIETSGKKGLDISRAPNVSSKSGNGGEWLLDPYNVDIVAGGGNTGITAGSPHDPSADNAQLGVDLITAALTSGDVTINTNTGGSQNGDINVTVPIVVTGPGNLLTLNAAGDINLGADISNFDAFEKVAVALNAEGTIFGDGFSVSSNGGDITLNAANGSVEIDGLNANGGSSAGGDIYVEALNSVKISGAVNASGDGLGPGDITIIANNGNLTSDLTNISFLSSTQNGGNLVLDIDGDIIPALDINLYGGSGGSGTASIDAGGPGNLTINSVNVSGLIAGGDLGVSCGGDLIFVAGIPASGSVGPGGAVTLTSGGSITVPGAINTSCDNTGGNVTVNAATSVALNNINTEGLDKGGDVTIDGNSTISIGSVSSNSYTQGGFVDVLTNSGNINFSSIRTEGAQIGGDGGYVSLVTPGTIQGSAAITDYAGGTSTISTLGDASAGAVYIEHNALIFRSFEANVASPVNGVFGDIAAGVGDNLLTTTVVGGDYASGDANLTIVNPPIAPTLVSATTVSVTQIDLVFSTAVSFAINEASFIAALTAASTLDISSTSGNNSNTISLLLGTPIPTGYSSTFDLVANSIVDNATGINGNAFIDDAPIADGIAPTLISATTISATQVDLVFSEAIDFVTDEATFIAALTPASALNITGTSGDNASTISLNLGTPIGTGYTSTIDIAAGAVTDQGPGTISNAFIDDAPIADGTAPILVSATTVSTTQVDLVFSETIDFVTDESTFISTLTAASALNITGTSGGNAATVSLNLGTPIPTGYSSTLDIAVGAVTDQSVGTLSNVFIDDAPIADGIAPILISATTISATQVDLVFSEAIDFVTDEATFIAALTPASALNITGTSGDNASTISLNLGTPIGTGYTSTIDIAAGAVIDQGPGTLSNVFIDDAPIADGTAPTLVSATTVSTTQVDLVFSEAIVFVTDESTFISALSAASALNITGTSGDNAATVSLNLGTPIPTGYSSTLDIAPGAVTDLSVGTLSNVFIDDAPIADGIAPTLISATTISATQVDLVFSEAIDFVTNEATFIAALTPASALNITGTSGDNASTISLNLGTPIGTDYASTLDIAAGAVTDQGPGTLSNVLIDDAPIVDGTAPILVSATTVSTTQVDLVFSETIDFVTDESTFISTLSAASALNITGTSGDNAATVSLNLGTPIPTGYSSTLDIAAGAVTDLSVGTLSNVFIDDAPIADGIAPTLISATAIDNSTVALQFNENMAVPTYTDGVSVSGASVLSLARQADNSIIHVNLDDLGGATDYTGTLNITLDAGDIINDANGVSAANQSGFVIVDGQAPVLQSAIAVNNTTVALQFSEDMAIPTFTDGVSVSGGASVSSLARQPDNSVIHVVVDDLGGSTSYSGTLTISIDAGDIINDANGISTSDQAAFAIGDGQVPTIVSSSLHIANSYVDVTFSEGVYTTDATNPVLPTDFSVTFNNGGDGSITAVSISEATKTTDAVLTGGETVIRFLLTINGTAENVDDNITITPFSGTVVKDVSDNAMPGAETTGIIALNDQPTGPVFAPSSVNNANTQITLEFSENVAQANGNDLRWKADGSREINTIFNDGGSGVTIDPIAAGDFNQLDGDTYTLDISVASGTPNGSESITFNTYSSEIFSDPADIPMDAGETITVFLTEKVPPTFVSATYLDNNGDGVIEEILIEMNEPMDETSANANDFTLGGRGAGVDLTVDTTPLNSIDLPSDVYVTLAVTNYGDETAISSETLVYTLGANGGSFPDLLGNDAAGTSVDITEVDGASPVIVGFLPTNGFGSVSPNASFIFTFSEDVQGQSTDGTEILFVDNAVPPNFIQIDVTDPTKVSFSGSDVTVTFPESLLGGLDYYVIIDAASFTEDPAALNDFTGLLNSTDYTFTVGADAAGPEMLSAAPLSNTEIQITFNESVVINTGVPATDFILTDGLGNVVTTQSITDGTPNDNKLILNFTNLDLATGDFVLTYNDDGGSVIEDKAGIPNVMVDDLIGVPVNYDVTPPSMLSGVPVGTAQLDVTFSDAIQISNLEPGDFIVLDGVGSGFTVTGIADAVIEDAVLELTVDNFSTAVGDLTLTYNDDDDTGDIEDYGGNFLLDDATGIIINTDVTAPTLLSASENSSTELYVVFDDVVQVLNAAPSGDFIVRDGINNVYGVSAILDGTPNDNQIELTIANVSAAIGDLTVTYNKTTTNIQDLGSNVLITDATGIVIDKDAVLPLMSSVIARGNNTDIVITFNDRVQVTTPEATDFTVLDGIGDPFTVLAINDETPNDNELVLTVNNFSSATGDLTVAYNSTTTVVSDFGSNVLLDNPTGLIVDYDIVAPFMISGNPIGTTQIDVTFSDAVQISNIEPGDFYVEDGVGAPFLVTGIADGTAEDAILELTIVDFSGATGDLTVTYDDDDNTGDIEDFGGNFLLDDLVGIVTGTDLIPPTLLSATENTSTQLYVFFDDAVQVLNAAPSLDFVVRDGINNNYGVSAISDATPGDTRIELTVSDVSGAIGDLTVTYNKSTTNIEDLGSNTLVSDPTGVVINKDIVKPVLQSAVARGNDTELVITFSDRVQIASSANADFTVIDGIGTPFAVSGISDESPNDDEIVLTVADVGTAIGDLTITFASSTTVVSDFGSNTLDDDATGVLIDYDVTAPALLSGTAPSNVQINVTFTDAVQISTAEPGDFIVVDGLGSGFTVTGIADVGVDDAVLELTVANFSTAVGDLTLTYNDDDDAGDIEDFGANFLADDAAGIVIDTDILAPSIVSVSQASSTQIDVTYNEEVLINSLAATGFSVLDGANNTFTVFAISDNTPGDNVIELSVNNMDPAIGDMYVSYTNSIGSVEDYGGNPAGNTPSALFDDLVDVTDPFLLSAVYEDNTTVTAVFSEEVQLNAVVPGDFTVVDGFGDNYSVTLLDDVFAADEEIELTVNDMTGYFGDLTVTYTGAGGKISDFGSNDADPGSAGEVVVIDQDADVPQIVSIVRQTPSYERTQLGTVDFRVTFDEEVQNVGAADFVLFGAAYDDEGLAVSPVGVAPQSIYDITISGVDGDGALDLNLAGGYTIDDFGSNAYAGAILAEDSYVIDNTAPGFNDARAENDNNSIDIIVNMDETGQVYYLLVERAVAGTPTTGVLANDVTNLDGGFSGTGGTFAADGTISVATTGIDLDALITGLNAQSTYDLYLVSEDEILDGATYNQSTVNSVLGTQTGGVDITLAAWTNLCLDGVAEVGDGGTTSIVIAERIPNDIKSGTSTTILLGLPSNFAFADPLSASLSFPVGSGLSGIVSRTAVDLATVTITATAGSESVLNTFSIDGLEVQATNTLEATPVNITRVGGSIDIYGASIGTVLGSVASKNRPNAPSINLAGTGDVTDGQFRIDQNGSFTLTASGSGGTYDWHYLDGSAALNPDTPTASVAQNSAWNTGGTFPNIFTNSAFGLYTLDVTGTDGDGCISDASDVDIAVFGIGLNPNTTSFTSDDTEGTTIRVDFPTSEHSGGFSGPGLGITDNQTGYKTVKFVPSSAGIDDHIVSFTLNRTSTGASESFTTSQTLTVTDANATIFSNPGSVPVAYCETADDNIDIMNVDVSDTNIPANAMFYKIALHDVEDVASVADGNEIVGAILDPAGYTIPGTITSDLQTDGWGIRPLITGPGTYTLVRYFVPNGSVDPENDKVRFGNVKIEVFDLPTVDLETILADDFCQYDSDETLSANVTHDGSSQLATFGSYLIAKETSEGSGTYGTDYAVASGDLDFSAILDGSINAGLNLAGGETYAQYRVTVTTAPADDPASNAKNCINTTEAFFTLYETPNTPVIIDIDGNDPAGQTAFEYCEDDIANEITIGLQGISGEKFLWDNDISFGSPYNGDDEKELLGNMGIGGPIATVPRYIRRNAYQDGLFQGCNSPTLQMDITVYQTESVPDLVLNDPLGRTDGPNDQLLDDGSILLEYCWDEALNTIRIDESTLVSGDPTSSYFTWYEDIDDDGNYDPVAVASTNGRDITVAELNGIGVNAGADGEYKLAFTQTDYNTGAGTGLFQFFGCETDLRHLKIDINSQPNDIVTEDGFTTEYFTCEGETLDDIATVNEDKVVYTWYGDDGDGVFEAGDLIIQEGGSIDDAQLLSSSVNGYDSDTPGTYYFWVTRKMDRNVETSFDGCESDPVLIAVTVFENYQDTGDLVNFESNGAGNDATLYFCNQDVLGTDEFSVASTFTDITNFNTLAEGTNYSATKKFNWYTSNASGDKLTLLVNEGGDDVTGLGDVITAQELFIAGVPNDQQRFVLVTQTTDIINDGAIYPGCEGPGVLIEINLYDTPQAPSEDSADGGTVTDFYYCFGDTVDAISVEGEDEGSPVKAVTFYWYESEDDALAGINRITTADLTGKTITDTELSLNSSPAVGDYTYYVTQSSDIVGGTFVGCESLPRALTVHIQSIPDVPTLSDDAAELCDNGGTSAIPDISILNPAGGVYNWVQDQNNDDLLDGGDDVLFNQDVSRVFTPLYGDMLVTDNPLTDATNNYIVSQTTDINIANSGFGGCESEFKSFTVTIHDIPNAPVIDGNIHPGGSVAVENEYVYCVDADISTLTIKNEADYNATVDFNWYTLNTSSGLIGTSEVDLGTIRAADNPNWPTINDDLDQVVNYFVTTIEDGCESSEFTSTNNTPVTVTLNSLPDLSIAYTDQGGTVPNTEFCVDASTVLIEGLDDGSSVPVGQDGTNPRGYFDVFAGLVDNADGTADFNPNDAHLGSAGDYEGGDATDHTIIFSYTDQNGCFIQTVQEFDNELITVNPLPLMELFSDDLTDGNGVEIFTTSDLSVEFCESENAFNLVGLRNNLNTGTRTLTQSYNGSDVVLASFTGSGAQDAFNYDPRNQAAIIQNEVVGVFDITYSFDDNVKGCSNEIVKNFDFNILPEIRAIVDGGCVDPDVEFDVESLEDKLLRDGETPVRPNNFDLSNDLSYKWTFYYSNSDGTINTTALYSDNVNDPSASSKNVKNPSHDFQFGLPEDVTEGIFWYDVIATTSFGCQSDLELNYTVGDVDIEINPNIATQWQGIIEDDVTSFYLNEIRSTLAKVEGIQIIDKLANGNRELLIEESWAENAQRTTTMVSTNSGNVEVLGPFTHVFDEPGLHELVFIMNNTNNCPDSLFRSVNIVRSIQVNPEEGYYETFDVDFDADAEGWFAELLQDDAILVEQDTIFGTSSLREQSWNLITTDLNSYNLGTDDDLYTIQGQSLSGGSGWGTLSVDPVDGKSNYIQGEDSWLYTPAFDLSLMNQPLMSFDMAYNFASVQDGFIVQFSIDDGITWNILGNYFEDTDTKTGLEWINDDNIQSDPGQQSASFGAGQSYGWSGSTNNNDADYSPEWVTARHKLDVGLLATPENRSQVQFRFAIAGQGETNPKGYFGFAMDDFKIIEREKNVLIENFYSVSNDQGNFNSDTEALDDAIADIIAANSSGDEVVLTYHADFGVNDPFNNINSGDPGARRQFYSVESVKSILDGGYEENLSSSLSWSENRFNLNSLKEPGVIIEAEESVDSEAHELKGRIRVAVNRDFKANTELSIYAVVIEENVILENPVLTFDNLHTNVVRKVLPDASGHSLKLESDIDFNPNSSIPVYFDLGDTDEWLDIQWDLVNITDDNELAVIIFVQDNNTKEVYQSVKYSASDGDLIVDSKNTEDDGTGNPVTSIGEDLASMNFTMYPNPANEVVTIEFNTSVGENLEWVLFDQTGRIYRRGGMTAGMDHFEMSANDIPTGVYYISVKGDSHEFSYQKLMIFH